MRVVALAAMMLTSRFVITHRTIGRWIGVRPILAATAGISAAFLWPSGAHSKAMPRLIEDNLAKIGELCRLHGVRKLEVFGSILRRDFDPP